MTLPAAQAGPNATAIRAIVEPQSSVDEIAKGFASRRAIRATSPAVAVRVHLEVDAAGETAPTLTSEIHPNVATAVEFRFPLGDERRPT